MTSSFSVTWRTLINDSACRASCHFFSTIPSLHIKRQRFCTFSFDPSSDPSTASSSYPSCSTSQTAIFRHRRTRKPLDLERNYDGELTIVHCSDSNTFEKKESKVDKQKFSFRGLKRVARKKPFWRKVLFASKKIRSIVLLNVITIVYGMFLLLNLLLRRDLDHGYLFCTQFIIVWMDFLDNIN